MALRNILLLTSDQETVKSVKAALNSNGQLAPGDVVGDVAELSQRLKNRLSPAVLVDIDGQPKQILSAMEPLARRFSDTKFIVLSGVMREQLLLEAMQAGAGQFILKETVGASLNDVLHHLCRDVKSETSGKIVTILSAGGGCGATTVAVNLTAELQALDLENKETPALAVDLDPNYGAPATYLSADSEYGMFDLLSRPGDLDNQLIQSTAVAVSNQMHVMVSLRRAKLGEAITVDSPRLGHAIECCAGRFYPWTVIDAPRLPLSIAADLIRQSSTTLLLMQMTVKDVHVARQMLSGLAECGIPQSMITVVANRYVRRSRLIAVPEAEKALGLDKDTLRTLSNDFSAVMEAVNLGKPLLQTSPRSSFRRELQKLAGEIAAGSLAVASAAIV